MPVSNDGQALRYSYRRIILGAQNPAMGAAAAHLVGHAHYLPHGGGQVAQVGLVSMGVNVAAHLR